MSIAGKNKFLLKLERMAEDLYRKGDSTSHDEAWERERSYLWGFGEAGKTIGLVTSDEVQRVIDRAHETVYGESRIDRIERLKPIAAGAESPDWDAFDAPTYERRRGKARA